MSKSETGTFETCPPILRMSAHRGRPEVAVALAKPTRMTPGGLQGFKGSQGSIRQDDAAVDAKRITAVNKGPPSRQPPKDVSACVLVPITLGPLS